MSPVVDKAQKSRFIGALGGIRTPDPQIRSLVLYPAELRAPEAFLTKSAFEFHLSFARPHARPCRDLASSCAGRKASALPARAHQSSRLKTSCDCIRLAPDASHAMSTSTAAEERPWPSPISPHSPGSSA